MIKRKIRVNDKEGKVMSDFVYHKFKGIYG